MLLGLRALCAVQIRSVLRSCPGQFHPKVAPPGARRPTVTWRNLAALWPCSLQLTAAVTVGAAAPHLGTIHIPHH